MIHKLAPQTGNPYRDTADLCSCGELWPCRYDVKLEDLVGLHVLRTLWCSGGSVTHYRSVTAVVDLDGVRYRFAGWAIPIPPEEAPRDQYGRRNYKPFMVASKLGEIRILTDEEIGNMELVVTLPQINLLAEFRLHSNGLLYAIDEKTGLVVLEIGTITVAPEIVNLSDDGHQPASHQEFVFKWDKRGFTPMWLAATE